MKSYDARSHRRSAVSPSIGQFLSGKLDLIAEQLDRLLSWMGYRYEISRLPVSPELTR